MINKIKITSIDPFIIEREVIEITDSEPIPAYPSDFPLFYPLDEESFFLRTNAALLIVTLNDELPAEPYTETPQSG